MCDNPDDLTPTQIKEINEETLIDFKNSAKYDKEMNDMKFATLMTPQLKEIIINGENAHNLVFSQCTEGFHHDGKWDIKKESEGMDTTRIINFNALMDEAQKHVAKITKEATEK